MAVLTDAKARNMKPEDLPLPHGGVTGLTLHPSTTRGCGKWVFRFVSPQTGKRRNAGLGSYPDVGIADAGKLARAMREQLAAGTDPLEARKALAEKPRIPTFEEAATILHKELLPGWKSSKHGKQWISTLVQYAYPKIGHKPVDSITPADIADVLRPIWLSIEETASRVKQRLHAVMAWSWARGHCKANPVDVVDYLLPQQPSKVEHQPAMPWRDIPAFVQQHLRQTIRGDVTRPMLEFLILTAARSGEVRGAVWQEFDLKAGVWMIPAERMKAKQLHRVPLSRRALEILSQQQGQHEVLVFPSPRDAVALSDMALTSLLRRVHAQSDIPERFATAHGFRSSFRDWCSEQGYSRDLAERALAHTVKNKVEAAYHRTDLLEQRRKMMEDWAKYVTGTETGTMADAFAQYSGGQMNYAPERGAK
ncbi:tyrosine-type recombinase/integrase [Chitinimonas sp. JJ19]|uniref:tyrosine-type recombinase/integrase n=1 Tax=Chitinimonas sp. JJ19 TaxID=3109352 RepID=UPI0030021F31